MGQLIYVVVSVLVSLLCIVIFGGKGKDSGQQHKKGFPIAKQGNTSNSVLGGR